MKFCGYLQARQGAGDAEKTTHRTMMLLAVAYAANIGGTALVTGSPPNLVLPSKLEDIYGNEQPLTFPKWASYCFPLMIANLLTAWNDMFSQYFFFVVYCM